MKSIIHEDNSVYLTINGQDEEYKSNLPKKDYKYWEKKERKYVTLKRLYKIN